MQFISKYGVWIMFALAVAGVFGRYLYKTPRYITGDQAAEITSKLPDSTDFRLSQLQGKYVLLDFWGSWCGPCIQEMPEITALYHQFHGKTFIDATDFEVVSIGIERDAERWQRAQAALNMAWPYQISDLQMFDSPIAKQYGIRVIPSKLLLNPQGVIIGTNQSTDEIQKVLTAKLK